VLFSAGLANLMAAGNLAFIEIGPKPTLLDLARRANPEQEALFLPSLRRSQDAWQTLLGSVAALYVAGADIDFKGLESGHPRRTVVVPTYPFERRRQWVEQPGLGGERGNKGLELLYELRWLEQPSALVSAMTPGRWLLLGGEAGLGPGLARELERRGHSACCWGAALASGEPRVELEVRRWLAESVSDGLPAAGIVDLRALDGAHPQEDLEQTARRRVLEALSVFQTIASTESKASPRLWLATRGARAASSRRSPVDPAQAPLIGLGLTIAHEHPELWGALWDLDPAVPEQEEATTLVDELLSDSRELEVCFRSGQRLVPRLAAASRRPSSPVRISPDATYLVSGGLGEVGRRIARWLVDRGARHLVLLSRQTPSPSARAAISELEAQGARIHAASVDVAVRTEVERLLSSLEAGNWPALRGVIHAAGVLDDGVLLQQDEQRFDRVMAPKLAGAMNLHRATEQLPLDFFVLVSSAAALFGSPGQGGYAAANAFLDALAWHRRQLGLTAVSVDFGAFSEAGMAVQASGRNAARLSRSGFEAISPAHATEALARILDADFTQAAVLAFDWSQLSVRLSSDPRPSILADLARSSQPEPVLGRTPAAALREELAVLQPDQARARLTQHVQDEVARILGRQPEQAPDIQRGFFELGMDSLMVLDLKNRLHLSVGHSLPATFAFNYPNVEALANQLFAEIFGTSLEAQGARDAEAQADDAVLAEIEQMDDGELEKLINSELRDLNGA
jgi:NAD(P)-dependent dehydrogenase (short-subunit alcohol dehydrogenase family)/acyl carrier protein